MTTVVCDYYPACTESQKQGRRFIDDLHCNVGVKYVLLKIKYMRNARVMIACLEYLKTSI